jgi:hypothetical protein
MAAETGLCSRGNAGAVVAQDVKPKEAAIGCLILAGAGLMAIGWCSSRGDTAESKPGQIPSQYAPTVAMPATAAPAATIANKPATRRVCKFSGVAGMPAYPLFPDEDGVSSGVQAFQSVLGKPPAVVVAFMKNTGAALITKDTRCAMDDLGLLGPSKVRVLEGDYVGRAGWVPTEWVHVEEPVEPAANPASDPAKMAEVASAFAAQYAKTKAEAGSTKLLCSQAGMTMAAFLGAKNEPARAKWRAIELADCKRAGVAPLAE